MIDAAIIQQCADPALKIEIAQQFVAAAGADDNLTITVRAGERVILVPKPSNPDAAMQLIQQHADRHDVRVGITQYPAGLGVADATAISTDLLDSCKNIRMGTVLFGKVYRIVTKWYGAPSREAFVDAINAYKSGWFENTKVFYEPDPGATKLATPEPADAKSADQPKFDDKEKDAKAIAAPRLQPTDDPNKADIRIDLNGIGEYNKDKTKK